MEVKIMHSYMRAIGFSNINNRMELNRLLENITEHEYEEKLVAIAAETLKAIGTFDDEFEDYWDEMNLAKRMIEIQINNLFRQREIASSQEQAQIDSEIAAKEFTIKLYDTILKKMEELMKDETSKITRELS